MINTFIYWRLAKSGIAYMFFDPNSKCFLLFSPAYLFLTGLIFTEFKSENTTKDTFLEAANKFPYIIY